MPATSPISGSPTGNACLPCCATSAFKSIGTKAGANASWWTLHQPPWQGRRWALPTGSYPPEGSAANIDQCGRTDLPQATLKSSIVCRPLPNV
ncbi:AgrD family cyclic lactone autoinducer peptide [Mesorhizobium sophorae]|uniref:AgrD family cyclic lactone autoinducer peptide n=1 Tax=Mesorhizobium sophorae TaxID=1300294 RepID=UPI003CC94001